MPSLNDAVNYLNSRKGSTVDFDGKYGGQCVDLFNAYYQFVSGRNPYNNGYGVSSAYKLYDVPTPAGFTKVANNPNNPNQLPPKGAIIIYARTLPGSGGHGHVEIVDSADARGLRVWAQNWGGVQRVQNLYHVWPTGGHVRGWLVPTFTTPPAAQATSVTVIIPTLDVRTGPGTQYPGNKANTVDGMLHQGMVVPVAATVKGNSYTIPAPGKSGDLWHRSVRGNYFAAGGCK